MSNFGVQAQDILDCYPGATYADWHPDNGELIINQEIELQAGKLMSYLPKRVVSILQGKVPEVLEIYVDNGVVWFNPTIFPLEITVYVYEKPLRVGCSGQLPHATDTIEVDYEASEERWIFTNPDDYDSDNIYIAVYKPFLDYELDNSLRTLLRDMAACALGRRIYAHNTDDFTQVRYHCEAAKEFIEHLNKSWMPGNWEGRFLFTSPVVKSIPIYRG